MILSFHFIDIDLYKCVSFVNQWAKGFGERWSWTKVAEVFSHTQTIMITPPLCGFPPSTESSSSSFLLAAPLVSHFKALKGLHPHQCWCRRERDKFFVNIGRSRKMDGWNMTTVDSFNDLQSKGGAQRTIK